MSDVENEVSKQKALGREQARFLSSDINMT